MNDFFGQDGVIELNHFYDDDDDDDDDTSPSVSALKCKWKSITNPKFARGTFGEISMALFRSSNSSSHHTPIHPTDSGNQIPSTLQFAAIKTIVAQEPEMCGEIEILRNIQSHPNLISLLAVYPSSSSSTGNELQIVTEYCPVDLYMSLEWRRRRRYPIVQQPLSISTIQCIMYDIFHALQYIHTKLHMIHNDIKPGNILISSLGYIKLCDFGLVQNITSTTTTTSDGTSTTSPSNSTTTRNGPHRPSQQQRPKGMTTLNYRSPEVLLGDTSYLPSMDMYAASVIFAELLLLPSSSTTLFHGTTEMEQLQQICTILGTPNANHWPEYKSLPYGQHFTFQQIYPIRDVIDLIPRCGEHETVTDVLRQLFVLDPHLRCSSSEAFRHEWFHNFKDNERQCRLFVQEELIPQELIEPIVIDQNNNCNRSKNDTSIQSPTIPHKHTDNNNQNHLSERENIFLAKIQALELASKRRSFLSDLDQWRQPC